MFGVGGFSFLECSESPSFRELPVCHHVLTCDHLVLSKYMSEENIFVFRLNWNQMCIYKCKMHIIGNLLRKSGESTFCWELHVVTQQEIRPTGKPGFICFQCRNENETAFGEKIESALDALVASPYLVGVGINCVSLRYASKLIDKFVAFQQDYRLKNPDFKKLEIIAYPNSGR